MAFADEIATVSDKKAKIKYDTVRSLSTVVTSWTLATASESFPFVALPHFEQVASDAMRQSEAELVAWLPLVTANQRAAFEQYAVENHDWIEHGFQFEGIKAPPPTISHEIFSLAEDNVTTDEFASQDYFVPLWQSSPAQSTAAHTLGDLRTHPKLRYLFDEVLETGHAILSDVIDVSFFLGKKPSFEPRSFVLEPVFAEFGENQFDGSIRTVVGFIAAVMPWRAYFANELPAGTGDILVEIANTCGATFTCST
jgi:CHASE domain